MHVELLYFGVLKDLFPGERETVELAPEETVEGLLRLLQKRASKHSEVWNALAVAVNREYAAKDVVLRDGDEVAILPPVSGGREEVKA